MAIPFSANANTEEWKTNAESLKTAIENGDYTIRLEFLGSTELQGVMGAYSATGTTGQPTIYLNNDWLTNETTTTEQITAVLLEELGHSFDNILNDGADSQGDEGEIFANIVLNNPYELSALQSENDAITINVDGQIISAEAAAATIKSLSITSTPANPTLGYDVGEKVQTTVVFSQAQTVTGTPTILLDIGGNLRTAEYVSGTGTTSLVFEYTIVPGDVDADGISIPGDNLLLNLGYLKNAAGEDTSLPYNTLGNQSSDKVQDTTSLDTTAPVFRSAIASGSTITLTYDEIGSGLNAAIVPATSVFTVTKNGGTPLTVKSVNINHTAQTVSLNLNRLLAKVKELGIGN